MRPILYMLVTFIIGMFPAFAQTSIEVTTLDYSSLRLLPDNRAERLNIIPPDIVLLAHGRTGDSSWIQVSDGDLSGWMARWLLITHAELDTLPVVNTPSLEAPPIEPAYVTTQDLSSLRAGPGRAFDRLAVVPPGTTLMAIGRTSNYGWWQVEYEGQQGWINYLLLVWTGDIATLPVDGINPPPFVRVAQLPQLQLIPVNRFTRLLNRVNEDVARGTQRLNEIEAIWRRLEAGDLVSCEIPELVAIRPLPEADLRGELIFVPSVNAMNGAIERTNRAVGLFEEACARETFISLDLIDDALNEIAEARRNFVLALGLLNSLRAR